MKISKKLALIVLLTVLEVSFTVWAVLQISKGATFHQLNSLHLKFASQFQDRLGSLDTSNAAEIEKLKQIIYDIREQPVQCLKMVNAVDRAIMKYIGTYGALELCQKDILDTDKAIDAIDKYLRSEIHVSNLKTELNQAAKLFIKNSDEFEEPISRTVSFIIKTMIPLVLMISFINVFLIYFIARTILKSIRLAIDILSIKKSDHEGPMEKMDSKIPFELRELLLVAQKRVEDDNHQKIKNEELDRMVDEKTRSLRNANEELAQFAYRASHDLKAPLTSVRGLSQYVCEDIKSGNLDEALSNSQRIYDRVKKLERLVVDILNLAKADLAESNDEKVDFRQIVEEVLENNLSMIKEKNVHIIQQYEHLEELIYEKARLSQIFENLITNAIKYSDPECSQCEIKICVSVELSQVKIVVKDNGLGFPPQAKDKIFTMFHRFHPEVAFGSGLGLSIVKKHIDKMKGKINLTTDEHGSEFVIILPKPST